MIDKDKSLPYPYLPDYHGTFDDRLKAFRHRLKVLLSTLAELELKFSQDNFHLDLLIDLEKCQTIANELINQSEDL